MATITDFLITTDRSPEQAQKVAVEAAQRLESHDISLLNFVESFGDYLNEDDAAVRSKAILFLSKTVECLSAGFLTRQQIQVLCQFLCDRIEDDLDFLGLKRLLALPRCPSESAVTTFQALVGTFSDLQTQPQSRRFQVLTLLHVLMNHKRQALKSLGSESIVGIVETVSGEKDPRNLMIVFSILKIITVEWDIRNHTEALFEAVFCYFPITFRPPPNDPYGITAQNLKSRLRECIAGSPHLAAHAFPHFIEKLDSASLNVKRDVLDAITACIKNYDQPTVSTYAIPLWDALRYEVFNAQDDALASEVLASIAGIAVSLSPTLQQAGSSTYLADYVRVLVQECGERLQEPQQKQSKAAAQVLGECIEASHSSLELIAPEIFGSLLSSFRSAELVEERRAALDLLLMLLLASEKSMSLSGWVTNPLLPLKDELFQYMSQCLLSSNESNTVLHPTVMKCLASLCTLPSLLAQNETELITQYLSEEIIKNLSASGVAARDTAVECLGKISKSQSTLISNIAFPALLSKLPDEIPDSDAYLAILEALARISFERELSSTLIRRVFNRLDKALQIESTADYSCALLSTLVFVLDRRPLSDDPDLSSHFSKALELVSKFAEAVPESLEGSQLGNINVVDMLGRLIRVVARRLDSHEQQVLLEQAYSLFCPDYHNSNIWSRTMSLHQRSTIIISTNILAAAKPATPLPFSPKQQTQLLDQLIRLSIEEEHTLIRKNVLQHIGLLSNKFTTPVITDSMRTTLLDPDSGLLSIPSLSSERLRTGFWITKALVLRLASVEDLVARQFDIMTDSKFGLEAARAFSLFLSKDEIVCKENGATIRLLAPQKLFQVCVATISARMRTSTEVARTNHLIALTGVIKYLDVKILMLEEQRLVPLLLQVLDLHEPGVKAAVTETLEILVATNPQAVESHVSSLVQRLLAGSLNHKDSTQPVRYASLRCLRTFPGKFQESKLLPYRQEICKTMQVILDDSRRDVRKEAVECKKAWLDLDETDEAD